MLWLLLNQDLKKDAQAIFSSQQTSQLCLYSSQSTLHLLYPNLLSYPAPTKLFSPTLINPKLASFQGNYSQVFIQQIDVLIMFFSIVMLFTFITKIRTAAKESSVEAGFHLNVEILSFDARVLASYHLNCSKCLTNLDLLSQTENYYQIYQHYFLLSLNCFPYGATNQAFEKCCPNSDDLSVFKTLNKGFVTACFFSPSVSMLSPARSRHPD